MFGALVAMAENDGLCFEGLTLQPPMRPPSPIPVVVVMGVGAAASDETSFTPTRNFSFIRFLFSPMSTFRLSKTSRMLLQRLCNQISFLGNIFNTKVKAHES